MAFAERLRELSPELRAAGIAAAVLAVSLVLPWYQKSYVPPGSRVFVQDNLSAFDVFTFVEAAVLLVAGAVLFLVWARSEGKGFHLPGGDGVAISLAGGWAGLLLAWRLFDEPDASAPGEEIGLQWGIAGALLAAAALFTAGARVRAAHRPEPPNPAADEPPPPPPDRPRRRPADPTAVTEVLADRPAWTGEPPEPPGRGRRRGGDETAWRDEPPGRPDAPSWSGDDEPPGRASDGTRDRLF